MKRGGYSGDKKMELKFRGSPTLYETIKTLAEQRETTMAAVMREMVEQRLNQRQAEGRDSSES
jgi:hypothetical protein